MILLGVLSGYSWGSFLTYLVFIDIVVLAICFALDRFVWSRDKGQTKNDRRNKRDEGDEEDGVDYRKLNESVVDYNEVKVVDEDSDDDSDAYSTPYGGVTPAGSDLSDDLFEGDEPRMADPDGVADDDGELDVVGMEDPSSGVADDDGDEDEGTDEDDVVKDDDVVTNNNLAYARYLNDDPSCRIISSDDFDEDARGNIEYLPDEDDDSEEEDDDDELTDVYIQQGDGEPVPLLNDDEDFGEDDVKVLNSAYPKNIDDELEDAPGPDDNMDDPQEEPIFND